MFLRLKEHLNDDSIETRNLRHIHSRPFNWPSLYHTFGIYGEITLWIRLICVGLICVLRRCGSGRGSGGSRGRHAPRDLDDVVLHQCSLRADEHIPIYDIVPTARQMAGIGEHIPQRNIALGSATSSFPR